MPDEINGYSEPKGLPPGEVKAGAVTIRQVSMSMPVVSRSKTARVSAHRAPVA